MDELKSINLILDDSYALEPIEKSVFAAVQNILFKMKRNLKRVRVKKN